MTAAAVPPQQRRPTPPWLLRPQIGLCSCGCVGRRRKAGFVSRTVDGAAALLRQVLFGADIAARRGLLQRLDPRVKLVTVVALLVAVGLVRSLPLLLGCYLATLPLAVASRVPIGTAISRVWLFVPLFTGIVVLPATLSVVTSGDVVWTLWHWHGHPEGVTAQGLRAAGLVVLRVATSISLVLLLTLTTPWTRLLAALRAVGVPRIFVLVIGMSYRYLFLLLATVTDMFTARTARSVAGPTDVKDGRRFVAATAGTVFGHAQQLSEEVHQAMTARGFRGEARTLDRLRLGVADLLWVVAVTGAGVGLLLLDGAIGA